MEKSIDEHFYTVQYSMYSRFFDDWRVSVLGFNYNTNFTSGNINLGHLRFLD